MQNEHASASLNEASRLAQEFQIRRPQVESVIRLLEDGCTVPYIARYAREKTGGLPEELIEQLALRIREYRQHQDRKKTILKNLEAQGKLTDELRQAFEAADTPRRLDDLYLPFKPKKKSTSVDARDRGLEPLALAIWNRDPAVEKLEEVIDGMVAPEKMLLSPDDVLNGVQSILAEMVADMASVRAPARPILWETGKIVVAKNDATSDEKAREYREYLNFSDSIRTVPAHKILAINRGERENILKVSIEADAERIKLASLKALNLQDHPHQAFLLRVADEAIGRLLLPSLIKEVRRELTEVASSHAMTTAARNLRSILMQPPLRGKKVLAIDPGIRNGCRVAVLTEEGEPLDDATIFPHSPQYQRKEAKHLLEKLIRKHGVTVIAIGNGTGSRDTEILVSELLHGFDCIRKGLPIPEDPVLAAPTATPTPPKEVPAAAATTAVEPAAATPAATESVVEETTPSLSANPEVAASPSEPLPTETVAPESVAEETGVAPPVAEAVVAPPVAAAAALEDLSSLPAPSEELAYAIVNESGSSDYSTSPVAREEFPELDPAARAAISIGRRLQDPLRELVKIEPLHISIGVHQQDVKLKLLKEALEDVVESCVNHVGVNLNKATIPLLGKISGLNPLIARDIVDHRNRNGAYRTREQLLQVPSVTPEKYKQAAPFLFVIGGDEPLDATRLHPEQYILLKQLISEYGFATADLADPVKKAKIQDRLKTYNLLQLAERWKVSEEIVREVFDAVFLPLIDPRDDLPTPILKKSMLQFEDLKEGQELQGTVLNVVQFGAFVDVGLRDSGLVHISQLANRFVRNPFEIVAVGDIVKVWVLKIDIAGKKVSLTMIDPHPKERERRHEPRPPRPERPAAPPRQDRPPAPRPQPGGDQQRSFQPRQGGGSGPGKFQRRETPAAPPPAPIPAPPPRKPRPDKPLPKLSGEALKGKAPLQTFGELAAFFKAKEEPPKPPEPPKAEPPAEKKPETGEAANG